MIYPKNWLRMEDVYNLMKSRQAIVIVRKEDDNKYILWGSPFNSENSFKKMENLMTGASISAGRRVVLSFSKL